MPPKQDDQTSGRSSRNISRGRTRGQISAQSMLTFVDSQDPNSRSTIQRHTAHHSNAQRRESRLNSLRSDRPRVLEWQRRSSSEADRLSLPSSLGESTSTSVSPVPGLRSSLSTSAPADTFRLMLPEQESGTSSEGHIASIVSSPRQESNDESSNAVDRTASTSANTANAFDDDSDVLPLVERYLERLSRHCPSVPLRRFRDIITSILDTGDKCCRCLLLANILASPLEAMPSIDERDRATRFYGQGTRLLRETLASSETGCSDQEIQAVLLLIAYAADTRSPQEVAIHLDALSLMTRQRVAGTGNPNPVDRNVALQMNTLPRAKRSHLTSDCGPACVSELRFPNGAPTFLEMFERDLPGPGHGIIGSEQQPEQEG